ncbi:MAG: cyclophilin-like fold protein [Enterococcus devriesei]|uniref:cyclophilin-like fold protein n=1 Tax=Enterococcus devriesei TaxID=319970 RepID=UPI003F905C07
MKRVVSFLLIALCGISFNLTACTHHSSENPQVKMKKIALLLNSYKHRILLEGNASSQELQRILPTKFSMEDLHQNEKYYRLPTPLPTAEESVGKIEAGDVLLYGNQTLVIFYHSFETEYRYTRIGRLELTKELSDQLGIAQVIVERNESEDESC